MILFKIEMTQENEIWAFFEHKKDNVYLSG